VSRNMVKVSLNLVFIFVIGLAARNVSSQSFNFESLGKRVQNFTVIIEMETEISFGIQTNAQKQRFMGTVVSKDGLVFFDGSFLRSDNLFSAMSGLTVKTTPTSIKVTTLDNKEYEAEFVGVDRFTQIGFVQLIGENLPKFSPIRFVHDYNFQVGKWLALYMLLPEFIEPPLSADIGLISTIIESPEFFPLTVGFGPPEVNSVLFDDKLEAVGVLGYLMDPSLASSDAAGMIESFSEPSVHMLGVITGERLNKLIANPPRKGEIDRAWLGISLQALTPDISEFLGLDVAGGIIVNDIVPQSPAYKADFKIGDVIYRINGLPVEIDDEDKIPIFQRKIAEMGPGSAVEFSVFRPSESSTDSLTILAALEAAPISADQAPDFESESLELKVRELVFSDFMAYNLDQETFTGVVVSELKPGGMASVGGLRLGDIIQEIDNNSISSIEDVEKIIAELENNKPSEIIFFIWRFNKTLFVNVKTDWL